MLYSMATERGGKMKLLIVGSRSIADYKVLCEAFDEVQQLLLSQQVIITAIISGGARGVDAMAEHLAKQKGINLIICPALWDYYGKSAGYKRNQFMGSIANCMLAIWDGKSKGTKHMIDIMNKRNEPVYTWRVKK